MARTKTGERKKREAASANDEPEEQEFEIEKITNKRGENKTLQYCVKWKGYPESDNTWENYSDLPKNLVKKYEDAEDTPKRKGRKAPASPKARSPSPRKKATPMKSPARGRPAKKAPDSPKAKSVSPQKKTAKKAPDQVVGRRIINNVVHYNIHKNKKPIPIYEFEDFEPIFEFELTQASTDESAQIPVRVIEKKGSQYNIEWEKGTKSWEDRRNLACVKLMNEFDDREDEMDDFDEDVEYVVQKIIGKRKNGRVYEYQVVWGGYDESTATWEPEDNLKGCNDKIRKFVNDQQKQEEKLKMKKKKNSEKRRNASPAKSGKRGRPKKE